MSKFRCKMYDYKGYTITEFETGYTVFFNGDEIYFDTTVQAESFVDEMENEFCFA